MKRVPVTQLCCVDGCHDESYPGCGGMCIDHAYEGHLDSLSEWHIGNYDYVPESPYEVYVRIVRDDEFICLDDIPF